MKILHVATGFSIGFPGGVTNYVRTLADSQVASGHQVDVLSGDLGEDRDKSFSFGVIEYTSKVIRPFVASMKYDDEGTQSILKIVNSGYDIIHFHLTLDFGIDFYESSQKIKAPYFISLHDYYLFCPRITMMDYENKYCGGPEAQKCAKCIGLLDQIDLVYRISRKVSLQVPRISSPRINMRNNAISKFFEGAQGVFPVSNRVKEIFKGVYPSARYEVLHIGSKSAEKFSDVRLHKESEKIRVTFMGVLSIHKGALILKKLIEGVNRSDIEFHFYGRTEGDLENQLKQSGLIIHGSYTPDQLPDILANTDLGVALPIWEDNGPQVVMEFINHHIPVLATRMGGIPDFVNESTGYLFDPYSADDIRRTIDWLDKLNKLDLKNLSNAIYRLTTPKEHQDQVIREYNRALSTSGRHA